MSNVIFRKILLNESGKVQWNRDGKIYCEVLSDGIEETIAVKEDILLASGIITGISSEGEVMYPEIIETSAETPNLQPKTEETEKNTEWTDGATKMLLEKYKDYLPSVGPMKRFKNKKLMWEQIAEDIQSTLYIKKSWGQVENRYKTVLKRKSTAISNNSTSGSKRRKIEFEEELREIAAIDDSIEPEVMQGPGKLVINEKPSDKAEKSHTSVTKVLKQLHEEKERNKMIRHEEKIALLRKICDHITGTGPNKENTNM